MLKISPAVDMEKGYQSKSERSASGGSPFRELEGRRDEIARHHSNLKGKLPCRPLLLLAFSLKPAAFKQQNYFPFRIE